MKVTHKELIDNALSEIETLDVDDAVALLDKEDTVFVDLRDPRELQREGKIPKAFHATRGMIEFWLDPESPYFKKVFDEKKRFLFHCKADWRSALTVQTVTTMGLENAAHIKGGLTAWCQAGGPFTKGEGRS